MADNEQSRGWVWFARIADGVGIGMFLWLIVKGFFGEELRKGWSYMQFSSTWIDWTLLVMGAALLLGRSRWQLKRDNQPINYDNWKNYSFTEVREKNFKGETVKLDGQKFVSCRFEDVIFEYEGTAPFRIINGNITAPKIGRRMVALESSHPLVRQVQSFVDTLYKMTSNSK